MPDGFGTVIALILAMIAGFYAIAIFAGLLIYFYKALALQAIAKKTRTPHGWMAWFPLLDVMLLCDIADVPFWAGLLMIVMPFANLPFGALASFCIAVWLVCGAAKNRKKSVFLGLLLLIPPVNLFALGYLAWSD